MKPLYYTIYYAKFFKIYRKNPHVDDAVMNEKSNFRAEFSPAENEISGGLNHDRTEKIERLQSK